MWQKPLHGVSPPPRLFCVQFNQLVVACFEAWKTGVHWSASDVLNDLAVGSFVGAAASKFSLSRRAESIRAKTAEEIAASRGETSRGAPVSPDQWSGPCARCSSDCGQRRSYNKQRARSSRKAVEEALQMPLSEAVKPGELDALLKNPFGLFIVERVLWQQQRSPEILQRPHLHVLQALRLYRGSVL